MGCHEDLLKVYGLMNEYFGDLQWWPADSPFEVMVGAVLTQNTSWTNVEKAITALKNSNILSPGTLLEIDEDLLAELIRPSGYYHLKAKRLKSLVRFFMDEYSGRIEAMSSEEHTQLREKLLSIDGIGPETADCILLYACEKPVFISDTYTKRILQRHGLIEESADFFHIRTLFMTHLQPDVLFYKQYHALFVYTGKTFCRKAPKCESCPLSSLHRKTEMH
jgi:endonuclease-3 related protein